MVRYKIIDIFFSLRLDIILISIYLPCKSSDSHYAIFKQCVDILHEIFETYENTHQIIIGGDFNENILEGIESQRKKYINDFISDDQLLSRSLRQWEWHLQYCQ
jgi:hypothetical protein